MGFEGGRMYLAMLLFGLLSGSLQAMAQDKDILTPLGDEPSSSTRSADDFNVTTKKIKGSTKIDDAKAVVALKPAAKSKFTPGSIDFAWKVKPSLKDKKSIIVIENIETQEKSSHPTGDKNLSVDLTPGKYRWQVMVADSTAQTFWRYLEVVDHNPQQASLKSIPSLDITKLDSTYEPQITHDEARREPANLNKTTGTGAKQARDLEQQVKAAQLEAKKAMRVAQEEQAHLADLKKKKLMAEKLEKQREAKAEADRLAQIEADKLAQQREKKLLAQKEKETRLAGLRLDRAQKKFRALVEQAKVARGALEAAIKESNIKAEIYKEAALKMRGLPRSQLGSERVPASETSETEIAHQ